MQTKRHLLLVSAAAVLALAGCASDRHAGMSHGTGMGAAPSATVSGARLAAADMEFAMTAAGTDMYEIQASQLAMQRGSAPAVRNYAQMLVNHHTMSSNELKGILSAKGMAPPPALPADKQAKIARLQSLQGAAFDREYIRVTGVQDHQAAIGVFENASRTLADADLRRFAAKTLPVLQQHLRSAQEIAGGMAG